MALERGRSMSLGEELNGFSPNKCSSLTHASNISHAKLFVFLNGSDLSMVLCDPFAMNTIVLSAMKALQHCINTDILPRVRHFFLEGGGALHYTFNL